MDFVSDQISFARRVMALTIVDEFITVYNGPEFICMALDKWAFTKGIKLQFSNAYIKSLNGKLRNELLKMNWFLSLEDLK